MTWLSQLYTKATFRPVRSIGGFTATLTVEEAASDELTLTEHPVMDGAAITDHAYLNPARLNIRAQWDEVGAGMPLDEMYTNLRNLQASRVPFDVVTGKRIYRNMLFKSLGMTDDATTDNILSITAQLQEIITVQIQTTTVPPRAQQKEPGRTGATDKAGRKKAQEVRDPVRAKSALKTISETFGG